MRSTTPNTNLNYYPFGSVIESRAFASGEYRYGMNGQEKDDELAGTYSAEYWQFDSRLGRRWNVDPVTKPHESSYAAFANNPIWFVDPNGADTSFAQSKEGLSVQKEFNDAIDELDRAIKAVEGEIKKLEEKAEKKNWSPEKYKKELYKKGYEYRLNDLKEVRAVFDEIICSPVIFEYSFSNFDKAKKPQNGSMDASYYSGQKVEIAFRKGYKDALVHENRHGVGVLRGEIGYGNSAYDFADEYEAFRHQQIFMVKEFHIRLEVIQSHELQKKQADGFGGMNNVNYSIQDAVKYLYGDKVMDTSGNQIMVDKANDPYQKFLKSKKIKE